MSLFRCLGVAISLRLLEPDPLRAYPCVDEKTGRFALMRNQAFNVVNGDVFRWQWMWNRIAQWFEIQAAPYGGEATPLELQLADAAPLWADIARKYSLVKPNLDVVASAWHTDADLSRPIEMVTDMSKSRKLGFREYQATDESFFDLFSTLRQKRIIP